MPSAASTRTSTRRAPSFVPLAFAESTRLPQPGQKPGASAPNRFYMYGVIGRLAMLAASYELEATDPEAESLRLSRRGSCCAATCARPARPRGRTIALPKVQDPAGAQ